MLRSLLSLSPQRLIATGLIVAGALLAILLIILWQVGVFDSPPPPATLESAVESVRQDEQQSSDVQSQGQQRDSQQSDSTQQQAQTEAVSTQQSQATSDSDAYGQQDVAETAGDDEPQASQGTQSSDEQASEESPSPQPQEQSAEQDQQSSQDEMTIESPSLADLAGTWTLSQQGASFVGYRIGEELANIGTTTAVGRTSDIVAALEFDGAAITAVTIEADLRTLKSDESFRDSALRTRGIETDTYPFATFMLTEPITIDALPTGEDALMVTVQGTLDLHGVTNPVSIALEGLYVDGLVLVVGSTEITLADYDIEKPTGFRVLSIEDVGIMEFQLVLERAP